jgi:alpha-amylase/alpha-mannosidase (GH57 family)
VRSHDGNGLSYLSGNYLSDLATWYLLAWSGESLRRSGTIIPEMMAKGDSFTLADRQTLLGELGAAVAGLIPRYRALADSGQIELSCTPGTHPLAPLMIDFNSAREAWPDCSLPAAPAYPGGRSRVADHLRSAQESHTRRFGQAPAGLWPAEGALSTPFLKQIAESGFKWTASSHGVLKHSAGNNARTTTAWQAPEEIPGDITLFFRNEQLSDLIGFEYANWHGRDAAQHFMTELKALHLQDKNNLIPIFLDGENAWEYYPYNGWYFFSDLYDALGKNPTLRTVTLSEAADSQRARRQRLPKLTAGSWVYGTLSTWIGNPEKNRAWEMLCDVKQCADRALDSSRMDDQTRQEVIRRLAICESSDWFWWLGDYNSPQSVACFDRLFRENLKALYRLLNLPISTGLDHPISKGGGEPESGGTMRRAT